MVFCPPPLQWRCKTVKLVFNNVGCTFQVFHVKALRIQNNKIQNSTQCCNVKHGRITKPLLPYKIMQKYTCQKNKVIILFVIKIDFYELLRKNMFIWI